MVLKFIASLLRANKNEQEEFYARQIPKGVFRSDRTQIKWLYDYRERHGFYPTSAAFKNRFPSLVLPKTKDSVSACVQTVLDQAVYDSLTKTIDTGRELYEQGSSISEVVGHLRAGFQDIDLFDATYDDISLESNVTSLKRYRERVRAKIEGKVDLAPSPWKSLNTLLGFSEWGESNIIASRTSIGKTWLLIAWADYLRRKGERVLVITKEMPTHQIADRFEAYIYKLPYTAFRQGDISPKILAKWTKARRRDNFWNAGQLIVSGQETVKDTGFQHIIQKITQFKPTVLFIDGVYLIWPENFKSASLVDRLMRVSNTLKRIAKVHKLTCFSTVQAKRESESRSGETDVTLKDLFGTDAWAQDADNVLLVSGNRGSQLRKIKLAKGRESAVGEFYIKFALNPYPNFGQTSKAVQVHNEDEKSVTFQTI